jgi:hypothetical protein
MSRPSIRETVSEVWYIAPLALIGLSAILVPILYFACVALSHFGGGGFDGRDASPN